MEFYIFDYNENVIAVLDDTNKEVFNVVHTQKLGLGGNYDENYLTATVPAITDKSEYVVENNYIGFLDLDNNFQMFRIVEVNEESSGISNKQIYCPHVIFELRDEFVEDVRTEQIFIDDALTSVLAGTRWEVGNIDNDFGMSRINVYLESGISALQKVKLQWAYKDSSNKTQYPIVTPRLTFSGASITHRYIDITKPSQSWSGKLFSADKDIVSLKRRVDISEMATAVYAYGATLEVEEDENPTTGQEDLGNDGTATYSNRLNIENVTWVKANSELPNPDFENGLTNWTKHEQSPGMDIFVSTDYAYVGTQSIQMIDYYVPPPDSSSVTAIESDYVSVTVGKTYSGRCLALVPSTAPVSSTNNYGGIAIRWFNASHVFLSATAPSYRSFTNEDQWYLMEIVATAPASAAYATLWIQTGETAMMYMHVDKARFGHAADKAAGSPYIEDPTSKAAWGYAGGTRNIFRKYVNNEVLDDTILIQLAWQWLQDHNEPKIEYEINVKDLEPINPLEKVRIGDISVVQDLFIKPVVNVAVRVVEVERNYTAPEQTKFTFGNFFEEQLTVQDQAQDNTTVTGNGFKTWNNGTVYQNTTEGTRVRLTTNKDGDEVSQFQYVDDDNNLVGYLNADEFAYKSIIAGQLLAQNITTTQYEIQDYYIDSDSGNDKNPGTALLPWKTLGRINQTIPKQLQADVTIYVTGSNDYVEDVLIDGYSGKGVLTLSMASGVVLNGRLQIRSCSCPIFVRGNNGAAPSTLGNYFWIHDTFTSSTYYPVAIYNCSKVRLKYCMFNANSHSYGVYCDASNVAFDTSIVNNSTSIAILGQDMSQVHITSAKGTNNTGYSMYSSNASLVGSEVTIPQSTSGAGTDTTSTLNSTGTATASPSNPSAPYSMITTTCIASSTGSFSYNKNEWRNVLASDYALYQGRAKSEDPYGNHSAFVYFNGTNKFSALSGKTIYAAKLKIRRKDIGGVVTAKSIKIYGHDDLTQPSGNPDIGQWVSSYSYGEVATIKWFEALEIDMPSAFLADVASGDIDGIFFYESTGSPYVVLAGYTEYEISITFIHSP